MGMPWISPEDNRRQKELQGLIWGKKPSRTYTAPAPAQQQSPETDASIGRIKAVQQNSGQGGDWSGYAQKQVAQQGGQQQSLDPSAEMQWSAQRQQAGADAKEHDKQVQQQKLRNILFSGMGLQDKRSSLIVMGYSPADADAILQQGAQQNQQQTRPEVEGILIRQQSLSGKRAALIGLGYSPAEADALLADQVRQAQQQQAAYEESERQRKLNWKNEQTKIFLGQNAPLAIKRANLIGLGYSPAEADALLRPT
jgi:Holliday junction resolvasome RuvABC DNA-binding subunit